MSRNISRWKRIHITTKTITSFRREILLKKVLDLNLKHFDLFFRKDKEIYLRKKSKKLIMF